VSALYDRTYYGLPCPVAVEVDGRRLWVARTEHSAQSAQTYFALLDPAVVVSLLHTLRLVEAAILRSAPFDQRGSARPSLVSAAVAEDNVHVADGRLEGLVHAAATGIGLVVGHHYTASVLHRPLTSAQ